MHVIIATVAVLLVAFCLGAFVAHFAENIADSLFGSPIFPAEIVLGLVVGFFVNRQLLSKSALWVWILPALWLLSDIPSSVKETGWSYTWNYLFWGKCADCVEQTILVAPFYTSLAYSLGAWIALKKIPREQEQVPSPVQNPPTQVSSSVRTRLMLALYSFVVVVAVFVFTWILVLLAMLVSHSDGGLIKTAFSRPYYFGEVAVALVGGTLLGPRVSPRLAKWVWIWPAIWLVSYMVYNVQYASHANLALFTWTHFFSGRCASSNVACPQETFGTCPFLISLGYSVGACFGSGQD